MGILKKHISVQGMQAVCNHTSFESDFSRILSALPWNTTQTVRRIDYQHHYSASSIYIVPNTSAVQMPTLCRVEDQLHQSLKTWVLFRTVPKLKAKLLTMQACDVDTMKQSRYLEQDKLRRWVVIGDDIPGDSRPAWSLLGATSTCSR
jgi:hypothetical protein